MRAGQEDGCLWPVMMLCCLHKLRGTGYLRDAWYWHQWCFSAGLAAAGGWVGGLAEGCTPVAAVMYCLNWGLGGSQKVKLHIVCLRVPTGLCTASLPLGFQKDVHTGVLG